MKHPFRTMLWNPGENRLRALARLVCQLALTIGCAFTGILALGTLLSYGRHHGLLAAVNRQTFDQIGNMIIAPFAAALIYITLKIGATKIERRDFSIYGVGDPASIPVSEEERP